MLSSINSTMKKIWKKMGRKAYRDSFVAAHISNTVSAQIAKLREKEGWTQTQLAERCGMRQSRISALEDPNYENYEIKTLQRIASTFDVGLTVRFVPFSEIARWAATLSEQNLLVCKFENDQAGDACRKNLTDSKQDSPESIILEEIMRPRPAPTTESQRNSSMRLGNLFPEANIYGQRAPLSEIPKTERFENAAAFQPAQPELITARI